MSLPLPNRAAERRSQDRDLCTVDDVAELVRKAMRIIDQDLLNKDGATADALMVIWNKLDDAGGLLRALRGKVETR